MTQEQKDNLDRQVTLYKPRNLGDEDTLYMNNGDIVQFTNYTYYPRTRNSLYEINNDSSWKIWYSQLAYIFYTDDIEPRVTSIFFSNGESYNFRDLDPIDLYNKCKGRKFKVSIRNDCYYIINKKSITMMEKNLCVDEVPQYIISCIQENRIEDIGDLLKTANAYTLQEM